MSPTMDSFSFLKYLRSSGGATSGADLAASVLCASDDTEEEDDHDQDDGPFFDLEFAAMTDDGGGGGDEWEEEKSSLEAYRPDGTFEEEEVEREFNFAVSTEGTCGAECGDGLGFEAFSPSDDIFFKGKLVPFDPSSIAVAAATEADPKPQIPAYFLRTATKVRVFLLGLRKPKPSPAKSNAATASEAPNLAAAEVALSPKKEQAQHRNFFVKFKVVDAPFVSFFARDGSTRSSGRGSSEVDPPAEEAAVAIAAAVEAEKKLVKEMVHKYLNKIKPLYVRVSRKYAERLRLASHFPPSDEAAAETSVRESEKTNAEAEVAPPPLQQPVNGVTTPTPLPGSAAARGKILAAGLRVVCKRLVKSRSASAAVASVPSPSTKRRDDSLLQQQDGIQSAIAHCKRSFTTEEQQGSEPLQMRSVSDPGVADETLEMRHLPEPSVSASSNSPLC